MAEAELKKFYADMEQVFNSPEFKKDPSVAFPFFAEKDVLLYDVTYPEAFDDAMFRKHFVQGNLAFPGSYQFLDMTIHAQGDIAFVTYVQHFVGQTKDGSAAFDVRSRTTDGLKKTNGKWRIVHEHLSMPLTNEALATLMQTKP